MYNNNSSPILNEVTFSNNTAHVNGGGIYNTSVSAPALTEVFFEGNHAEQDGGGMFNDDSSPTLSKVIFNNNSAVDIGGGMSNDKSNPVIIDVTFSSNQTTYGGGMHNNKSHPTLSNVTFSNNQAIHGGGMFNSDSHPTLTNVTFSGNSVILYGGGLYNINSSPTFTNVTISNNSADYGGGLFVIYNSQPILRNVITVNNMGDNCSFDQGGSLSMGSGNNLINDTSCGLINHANGNKIGAEYDADLGALQNNGGFTKTLALSSDSAALDAGNDSTCPATDQRGVIRPQGEHCDMGAYEVFFQAFTLANKWTSAFDLSHGWTVKDYVRTVGDVNGDGRADLVGFGLDGVYVALSTGSGFGPISKWTNAFDLSHGWTVNDYVRTLGDVNGDGRADLVGFGLDGVHVSVSDGSTFGLVRKRANAFDLSHGWTVKDYVRTIGDVNGDSMADLVGFGLDGVYVALSNGTTFGPANKWTSAFDLSHGWTVSQHVRTVGDVDGDGRVDLVGFGLDGVYIALSTGSGFGPVTKWTNAFDLSHGWTVKDYVRTIGDVNNDKNADLIGFGLDGVYVGLAHPAP